jgi:LPXTG-motif cell wall-anchored protein
MGNKICGPDDSSTQVSIPSKPPVNSYLPVTGGDVTGLVLIGLVLLAIGWAFVTRRFKWGS